MSALTHAVLPVLAQAQAPVGDGAGLGFWLIVLAALAILPFVLTMVTAFAKLVVVGGILRQALGTQNIPPNSVITGLALILTVHIMWPVVSQAYTNYQQLTAPADAAAAAADADAPEPGTGQMLNNLLASIEPPMRRFLTRHSSQRNVALFENLRTRLQTANAEPDAPPPAIEVDDPLVQQVIDDLLVLAPAFVLSELTEAFQIGFVLFVPFLVIDLAVSTLLLAMGMHMLSPITFSLPLKLLLFVLIDGWKLLFEGLVSGYF